jgi:hypothetical protein
MPKYLIIVKNGMKKTKAIAMTEIGLMYNLDFFDIKLGISKHDKYVDTTGRDRSRHSTVNLLAFASKIIPPKKRIIWLILTLFRKKQASTEKQLNKTRRLNVVGTVRDKSATE